MCAGQWRPGAQHKDDAGHLRNCSSNCAKYGDNQAQKSWVQLAAQLTIWQQRMKLKYGVAFKAKLQMEAAQYIASSKVRMKQRSNHIKGKITQAGTHHLTTAHEAEVGRVFKGQTANEGSTVHSVLRSKDTAWQQAMADEDWDGVLVVSIC